MPNLDKILEKLLGLSNKTARMTSPVWVYTPSQHESLPYRPGSTLPLLGDGNCKIFLGRRRYEFDAVFNPAVPLLLSIFGYTDGNEDAVFFLSFNAPWHLEEAKQVLEQDCPDIPVWVFDEHRTTTEGYLSETKLYSGFAELFAGTGNDAYLSEFSEAALVKCALSLTASSLDAKTSFLEYQTILASPIGQFKNIVSDIASAIGTVSLGRENFPADECLEVLANPIEDWEIEKLSVVVPSFYKDTLAGQIMSILDKRHDYFLAWHQLSATLGIEQKTDRGSSPIPTAVLAEVLGELGMLERIFDVVDKKGTSSTKHFGGIAAGISDIIDEMDSMMGGCARKHIISYPYEPEYSKFLRPGALDFKQKAMADRKAYISNRNIYDCAAVPACENGDGFSLMIFTDGFLQNVGGVGLSFTRMADICAVAGLTGLVPDGFGTLFPIEQGDAERLSDIIEKGISNGDLRVIYDDSGRFSREGKVFADEIGALGVEGYLESHPVSEKALSSLSESLAVYDCDTSFTRTYRRLFSNGNPFIQNSSEISWEMFEALSFGDSRKTLDDYPAPDKACVLFNSGVKPFEVPILAKYGFSRSDDWQPFMEEFCDVLYIWKHEFDKHGMVYMAPSSRGMEIIRRLGRKLGIDYAVDAYYSGIRVEDIEGR